MSRKLAAVIGLILILLITSLSISSCEPIAPFKIRNNTDQAITLIVNGTEKGTINPHSEFKPRTIFIAGWFIIEAKDSQGSVVYSQKFTYEELEWLDWKIVIPANSQ